MTACRFEDGQFRMGDPLITLLASNKTFQGLTIPELQDVRAVANMRRFKSGSFIIRQGDPALALYVMFRGSAKLTQVTPDGHQVLSRFLSSGDGYGIASALDDHSYLRSLQAISDCQFLVWHGDVFATLIERYNRISFNALRIAVLRNQEVQSRYEELLTESVEQRVAQALLRLCGNVGRETNDGILIDVPLSREDLAESAGTTVYSVSRLLQRWERAGWVRSGRGRVVVLDLNKFREFVTKAD
jgi:CRP-like cAMP-binding protein